jgi:hypothetical protein
VLRDHARLGGRQVIDEDALGQSVLPEQRSIARRNGFAAQVDRPKMREPALRGEHSEKLAIHGGDRVQHADPLAIQPIRKPLDPIAAYVVSEQRRAVEQARVDVHVRTAEAQRVQKRQTIGFLDPQRRGVRVGKEEQIAVRLTDTLGLPGRPRGVVEVDQRVRRYVIRHLRASAGHECLHIHDLAARRRQTSRAIDDAFLREQRDRLAVPDDETQALVGIAGVERNVGASAASRSEKCLGGGELAFEQRADHAGTITRGPGDATRDGMRCGVELRVSERCSAFAQRHLAG